MLLLRQHIHLSFFDFIISRVISDFFFSCGFHICVIVKVMTTTEGLCASGKRAKIVLTYVRNAALSSSPAHNGIHL